MRRVTPLSMICGVDFVVESSQYRADQSALEKLAANGLQITVEEVEIQLRGRKP